MADNVPMAKVKGRKAGRCSKIHLLHEQAQSYFQIIETILKRAYSMKGAPLNCSPIFFFYASKTQPAAILDDGVSL